MELPWSSMLVAFSTRSLHFGMLDCYWLMHQTRVTLWTYRVVLICINRNKRTQVGEPSGLVTYTWSTFYPLLRHPFSLMSPSWTIFTRGSAQQNVDYFLRTPWTTSKLLRSMYWRNLARSPASPQGVD